MEKVNIFNQMAQYDFGTPINVTMVFEDDSDDEYILEEQIQTQSKDTKRSKPVENTEITQHSFNSKDKNISIGLKAELDTIDLSENETDAIDNNDTSTTEVKQIVNNAKPIIEAENNKNEQTISINNRNSELTEKTTNNLPDVTDIHQHISDKEELTRYVKDLLNTLSEHIILIMKAYYFNYSQNHGQPLKPCTLEKLSVLKKHFFDLSYSSVVSLILPQEKNEQFIQRFIDKTVYDANKGMNWKCGRKHVESVYNDLIEWTKKRRESIKNIKLPNENRIEDNTILKKHLNTPSQPLNFTPTANAPLSTQNYNKTPAITSDSTCIFSYGAPGREISINVNADTLLNNTTLLNERNQSINHHNNQPPPYGVQSNENTNNYPQNKQYSPTIRIHCNSHVQHLPHNSFCNNTAHHYQVGRCQAPPPYNARVRKGRAKMPEKPNRYNGNQIQRNIAYNMHNNYDLQKNMNSFSTSTQNSTGYNVICGAQHLDGQAVEGPIITNVTSLNHAPVIMNGRCCICGKFTNGRCLICNQFTYCSALCQEMDPGIHKLTCGKT